MQIIKLLKFVFFNVILPIFDISTDVHAFILYLFYDNHPNWAYLTLFWIFNPFLVQIFKFVFILYYNRKAEWCNLFLHLPFVIPIKNCWHAYELHKLDFGEAGGKAWEEAEKIQREVAKASLSESYFEAGPQASQQLIIGFTTGQFRWSIILSIVISLFSLSWGASRAFFIERSEDESDPDPNVKMVGLRVLPYMILMVANSLIQWVLLGGLLGPWVFLVMAVNFLCNYATVKCFYKSTPKNTETTVIQDAVPSSINVRDNDEESGQEMTSLVKTGEPSSETVPSTGEQKRKEFFPLKSSLNALWLPAVVGDQECVFLSTVVSTLVVKILALILAVGLSGHQQRVFRHPMVLWCEREEDWEPESLAGNITLCSFDSSSTHLTSCFNSSMSGVQKLRVCGSDEDELILRISILVTVIVSSCLSLGAALWLNNIIDYVKLFKATKTLCFLIPTDPVVHRSALFSVVNSTEEKDLETLTEMMEVKGIETVINRPNAAGDTVLHQACQKNFPKKAALLLKHGAKSISNSQDEMPAFSVISSIGAIDSFLEELKTGISDISDFIGATNRHGKSAFKIVCNTSDWRSALYLKTGTLTGDSSKAMEEILTKEALGIQHIVECPALIPLLKTWSTADNEEEKKEAEQKIEAFFTEEIKMIFLPTLGMEEERKEWNRCHPMKMMAQLQTRPDEWSDREMATGSKLTGISIRKREDGYWIAQIRAR